MGQLVVLTVGSDRYEVTVGQHGVLATWASVMTALQGLVEPDGIVTVAVGGDDEVDVCILRSVNELSIVGIPQAAAGQ